MRDPQCFLSIVNYLNKYSPGLAELGGSLRDLTKKNVLFVWGQEHAEAFESIKKETTNAPILENYDLSKPSTLQTDANLKEHGTVLLQGGQPNLFCQQKSQAPPKSICWN